MSRRCRYRLLVLHHDVQLPHDGNAPLRRLKPQITGRIHRLPNLIHQITIGIGKNYSQPWFLRIKRMGRQINFVASKMKYIPVVA
jgi:hypothetical protein